MSAASTLVPVLTAAAVVLAARRWTSSVPPESFRGLVAETPQGPGTESVRDGARSRWSSARPGVLLGGGIAVVWWLGPVPLVAVGAMAVVVGAWRRRRADARVLARRDRVVPDLIDLFVIAAAAGHTAHGCVHAVAARAPRPVQPVVARASRRLHGGEPIQVVLSDAGADLGPLGAPLAGALAAGAASGAPMAQGLGRVADAAREARRRQAEEQARRLPVTLLFPLVMCILPAFLLLAVVPLLVGSLGSLQS